MYQRGDTAKPNGTIKIFENHINGAITTSLKSVVSEVCQIQGRSALRCPVTAGRFAIFGKNGIFIYLLNITTKLMVVKLNISAESTTLGPIIGNDHITTFFEVSFLPIRWEIVEKALFNYSVVDQILFFFNTRLFEARSLYFYSVIVLVSHEPYTILLKPL